MVQELPVREFKDGLYRQFARIGKCLSSDKRLELMHLLSQGPKTVEKMADITGMSVANVSRHLQILLEANMVKYSKKGTYVIYSLTNIEVERFINALWKVSETQLGDISRLKNEFISQSDDLQILSLEEVISKMDNGTIILLDVRPTDEFEAGHIPGALSVPLEDLNSFMQKLPKGAQIAAYCRGPYCIFSAEAVAQLRLEGFTAFRMEEGVYEWREQYS